MLDKRDFYINGKWVSPTKANDFEVINPSTEEVRTATSLGDQVEINSVFLEIQESAGTPVACLPNAQW